MSLKQKTIHGLSWSLLNNVFMYGFQLIVGIILARLLSPKEFGLIGMTAIFTAIAQSFVDSGFSTALIRKKDCSQDDFSTVFYYNLFVGILLYLILFFSAPFISNFFNEEALTNLIRVIGLNIIILSITQIQRTRLIKNIDFKRLTLIIIASSVISGAVSIYMAFTGFGVWSLVFQLLIKSVIESILLWGTGRWSPSLIFSGKSFKELFGFGSKIIFSVMINTIYQNIYNFVIGKYFSTESLGYYTRAKKFSNLVSQNLSSIIEGVTFPALSSIGDNIVRLKENYKKILIATSLLTFSLSLVLAASAESIIIVLLGEKWSQSIPYLQLLCFSGMLYPLHSLNLNILKVKGRSDLYLKLEILKKILLIPTIVVGLLFGIIPMLFMGVLTSFVAYFLNSYYSGKLISYPTFEQIKNVFPGLLIALIISFPVYIAGILLNINPIFELLLQAMIIIIGLILVWSFSRYTGVLEIKEVVRVQINKIIKK